MPSKVYYCWWTHEIFKFRTWQPVAFCAATTDLSVRLWNIFLNLFKSWHKTGLQFGSQDIYFFPKQGKILLRMAPAAFQNIRRTLSRWVPFLPQGDFVTASSNMNEALCSNWQNTQTLNNPKVSSKCPNHTSHVLKLIYL